MTLMSATQSTEILDHKNADSPTPWYVLIADDESSVHEVTQMVLKGYSFDNRPIGFLSAYSGQETVEILRTTPAIAVILLDVVMENNIAGLDTVNTIRNELGNRDVRIIIRTGQAGTQSVSDVIRHYEINDYREKNQLDSASLRRALTFSLRAYRDICNARAT